VPQAAALPQPEAIEPPTGRGAGLTLAERVGVIEIDLPDGIRGHCQVIELMCGWFSLAVAQAASSAA
jgi:hypothetical protein